MLKTKMPSYNDKEESTAPDGLPPVTDAHVHVFPHNLFSAIWKWFDEHAWHIRYPLTTSQVFAFFIEKYDNLWLDTTMVLTDYFQFKEKIELGRYRSDRIIYGSDFPGIPYAWDRELKGLKATEISRDVLEKVCWKNAADFFAIQF